MGAGIQGLSNLPVFGLTTDPHPIWTLFLWEKMKYKILRFKGTRNDETKQVCGGWLYLEFLENCQTVFKMAIKTEPTDRNEGDIIAVTVHGAKNRREAIDFFERNYTIL